MADSAPPIPGSTGTTTATTAPGQPAGAPALPALPATANAGGPFGLGEEGKKNLPGSGQLFYGTSTADVSVDDAISTFLGQSPAVQAQIQQQMLQAGLYPKGTVPLPGHLDAEDLNAFKEAARMSMLTSTNVGDYLAQGANATQASGVKPLKLGVIQPGVVQPGVVGGGSHYTVHLTNPDEAMFIAQKAARAMLGENTTQDEVQKIYTAITTQERTEQAKVNAATEDERQAQFAARSAENTSQFNARVAENTGLFQAKVAERDQQFASQASPGGTSGPGGGIVSTAQQLIGVPYKWGGTDTKAGMDCSGFTQAVLAQNGIQVGRDTSAQVAQGTEVGKGIGDLGNAQPGDLVFFGDKAGDHAHVGIYIGNGQMISEPHSGAGTRVDDVSGWSASGEKLYSIRRYTRPAADTGTGSASATSSAIDIKRPAPPADTSGAGKGTGDGRTPDVQLPNQRLPDAYIPAVSTEAVQAPSAAAAADKVLRTEHPVEAGISDSGLNNYGTMLSIIKGAAGAGAGG